MKKQCFFLLLPLVAAAWLLCLSGCQPDPITPVKQDPCPWPDITTEGLNTFGCKIDGKEWVPCVDLYGAVVGLRPIYCTITELPDSNILGFSMMRSIEDSLHSTLGENKLLTLRVEPLHEGYFKIPNDFSYSRLGLYENEGLNRNFEKIDSSASNFIQITRLDMVKKIVSGTFEFTLLERNTGEKTHITDGRFDIIYFPQ